MKNGNPGIHEPANYAEKRSAALHSVLTALALTAMKLAAGLASNSLGVLSEAANSGLDIAAAAIIYWTVLVSDKPADADHQYGHAKVENFTAFLQTGLVLATCLWIIVSAIHRLLEPERVAINVWAVGVMLVSIVASRLRERELRRAAEKYHSQALESHALNYSLDVWSARVVLIGLGSVWLANTLALPQLRAADPIAALAVAGFVLYQSARLGRQTIDALLDAAPVGMRGRILDQVRQVPGVVACERVRVRHAGSKFFVDLNLALERAIAFDHVPEVLDAVRSQIGEILPDADIMIHTEPRPPQEGDLFEKVKWIARRNNLAVHDLLAHEVDGQLTLDLHLEVDRRLTLDQAHEKANILEAGILEEIPDIAAINTHIEDEGAHVEASGIAAPMRDQMALTLERIATEIPDILDCHDISIREINEKIYVSCHALMNGSLPITRVHDRTVELEALFKKTFPAIHKVTIHTEPESERGAPLRLGSRQSGNGPSDA